MLLGLFLPASSFSFLYHLMLGAGFPATISHFRTVFFPSSTVTFRRSFNLGSTETKQNIKQNYSQKTITPHEGASYKITPHSQYISSVEAFKEALLNCHEITSNMQKKYLYYFFAKYYSGTHINVLSVKKYIIPDICFNRSQPQTTSMTRTQTILS